VLCFKLPTTNMPLEQVGEQGGQKVHVDFCTGGVEEGARMTFKSELFHFELVYPQLFLEFVSVFVPVSLSQIILLVLLVLMALAVWEPMIELRTGLRGSRPAEEMCRGWGAGARPTRPGWLI
jgi:hypothetical protein